MDALALLCNLHADGPATLQRLRRAGLESLVALRRTDPGRLAQELGWNERTAERFLREAALLRGRVEGDEQELDTEAELELEATLLEELDGESAAHESEPEGAAEEPEEAREEPAETVPPAERVEAVLGAWRELDRVAPPGDPADFVIPRPPPPPDLELARLEELDPPLAARLAEVGVSTLRQLLERNELELARTIPLGFTRLRHLRYRARRALEHLAPAEPEPASAPGNFRAFTPPPSEPFETAGPFA